MCALYLRALICLLYIFYGAKQIYCMAKGFCGMLRWAMDRRGGSVEAIKRYGDEEDGGGEGG